MVLDVDRRQVLAYRVAAHGLARDTRSPSELTVLDLGVQDTPAGSARLALAARLPAASDGGVAEGGPFALAWSIRGAPHVHRAADLPELAAALWPLSDADAVARLAGLGPTLKEAGVPGRAAFRWTADAVRAVVTGPLTKGELSAAVTERVPDALSSWCRGCQSRHVNDQMLRLAALPAGVRIEPDRSPLTFVPIDDWPGVPTEPEATASVVSAYLRLLGPATPADVAGYLGTTRVEVQSVWPDDVAEVRVDGRRAWLPEAQLAALREAPPARLVRLLPPSDPYLQGRDRALLLPDKAHQAALWRALSGPGAVLVDGEIAGLWRARVAGKARLEVVVSPFGALSAATRAAVEDEAGRLATVRGATAVQVRYGVA